MFNGAKLVEEEIPVRAKYFLIDYKQHQQREEVLSSLVVRKNWQKPTMGRVSVCTNADILPSGDTRLVVVVGDAEGIFMYAAAKNIPGTWTSEGAEALALEMGVQVAYLFQLQNVMMETDCLSVITRLQSPNLAQDEIGVVCHSIERYMSLMGNSSWRHICREANNVAHIMAHAKGRSGSKAGSFCFTNFIEEGWDARLDSTVVGIQLEEKLSGKRFEKTRRNERVV
ncbi:unnamed protein product [Linum trigynum]|uniref:RNase H type-1 domain-containing protein n=1 Tax=Linum trigynum TaxID=586398 RepID=A0AAV2G769_9ROSI